MLDHAGYRATFFVLGDVARHAPALVRRIAARGHEVGSHGMLHRFVGRLAPTAFRAELRESIRVLEDIAGTAVESFRAPWFSIGETTPWAFDVLAEEGIRRDSSVFPIRNHRYGAHRAHRLPHAVRPGLDEWPISTFPTPFGNLPFAGGVYFRVLPYAWIEHAMAGLERRGEPLVFYFHPWELDCEQPRLVDVPPFLAWRHSARRASMATRLARLLSRVRFTSLRDVSDPRASAVSA